MRNHYYRLAIFVILLNVIIDISLSSKTKSSLTVKDPLLFVSTLGGSMYAVNQRTGKIQWKLNEGNYNINIVTELFYILLNIYKDPVLKLPEELENG